MPGSADGNTQVAGAAKGDEKTVSASSCTADCAKAAGVASQRRLHSACSEGENPGSRASHITRWTAVAGPLAPPTPPVAACLADWNTEWTTAMAARRDGGGSSGGTSSSDACNNRAGDESRWRASEKCKKMREEIRGVARVRDGIERGVQERYGKNKRG